MAGPSTINPGNFAWSYGSIAPLTAATGETGDTVADVGAAFSQETINDNFKALADKVNAIIAVLQANGTLS